MTEKWDILTSASGELPETSIQVDGVEIVDGDWVKYWTVENGKKFVMYYPKENVEWFRKCEEINDE